MTHHFKLTIFSPYLTSKYESSSCTKGNLILIFIFIPLLCWTQQRSRSIFLMQYLYNAKCNHMRHNTKQGNPVYTSTVPGYATVNTSRIISYNLFTFWRSIQDYKSKWIWKQSNMFKIIYSVQLINFRWRINYLYEFLRNINYRE